MIKIIIKNYSTIVAMLVGDNFVGVVNPFSKIITLISDVNFIKRN